MRLGAKAAWTAGVLIPVTMIALAMVAVKLSRPAPNVPLSTLLIEAPPELPGAENTRWTVVLDKVERERVGLVSGWSYSDVGAIATHEVGQFLTTFIAQLRFRTGDIAGRYERLFSAELVRRVDPPQVSADVARVLCGNTGKSTTEELEDCQIWNFRARYGQYVANLEIYSFRMTKGDFFRIVEEIDQKMADALAR